MFNQDTDTCNHRVLGFVFGAELLTAWFFLRLIRQDIGRHWRVQTLGDLFIPYRGAPTAGDKGSAVLSSSLAAGGGIPRRRGCSGPLWRLGRGGGGPARGGGTPLGPPAAAIPFG